MSLKQITLKDYLHIVIKSVFNNTNKKIVSFLKDGDGDYHRINSVDLLRDRIQCEDDYWDCYEWIDNSEGRLFIETAEISKDEDYRYEIYNKNGQLIEEGDGYVCLETAIERALKSDGEYIKQMWYPIGEDGELNADDCSLIGSDMVWEREDCM